MSYDIHLEDPVTKKVLHTKEKHDLTGGTYVLGGTTELTLNMTYNYSEILRRVIGGKERNLDTFEKMFGGGETGIRLIYGKTGAEAIPILENAIDMLDDDVDPDYWKATDGNVKQALHKLLAMARMRPDGVFNGD